MVDYNLESQKFDTDKLLSKINSAGLINIRISRILDNCLKYSTSSRFLKWNSELDGFYRELSGDIDPKSDLAKGLVEINKKLKEQGPLSNGGEVGFNKVDDKQVTKRIEQYELLQEKEMFVRRIMHKQGKGTAYAEDEDDFD